MFAGIKELGLPESTLIRQYQKKKKKKWYPLNLSREPNSHQNMQGYTDNRTYKIFDKTAVYDYKCRCLWEGKPSCYEAGLGYYYIAGECN